jgi:glutathione synthase/RimK-type ligase-like ATP-grasp enzyme
VRACAVLGADYAGVDLLGGFVLEVNGIPGWSGVERACGVDVASALVSHVEVLQDA